ncbi:hypothetical protein QJQ45_003200 [Haematococcus lacustris]|nr:hypothetical protein QJQ45_003200 [Haematococcus lacustris]
MTAPDTTKQQSFVAVFGFVECEKGTALACLNASPYSPDTASSLGAPQLSTTPAPALRAASCQRRGRVVLVDEHRTSLVSSAVNGQQPCEEELDKLSATRPARWKPPAGQVEHRLVRPAWSQQRDQPVRGLMWCPVVTPRKPPQAPRSSQAATQPAAASEPGPSTPPPAKRSKRTMAEPGAEPTKGTGKGKGKGLEGRTSLWGRGPALGTWASQGLAADAHQ